MNEEQVKQFKNGKTLALWLGGAVYAGVVLLFVSFYENLMADRFEGLLQVFARIGAFLVSANAIALPVALHYWTVTKWHKVAGIIFYSGDILLMSLNVLAAANVESAPPWLEAYQTFAPATIIFVLAGWAVLFMTDPGQRALVGLSEAIINAQVSIVSRASEYVNSDDGIQNVIEPFAGRLAGKVFNERSLIGSHRAVPASESDTNTENGVTSMEEIVKQVIAQMSKVTPNPENGVTVSMDGKNGVTSPLGVSQETPFSGNGNGSKH